jgi:hypothetical protein
MKEEIYRQWHIELEDLRIGWKILAMAVWFSTVGVMYIIIGFIRWIFIKK